MIKSPGVSTLPKRIRIPRATLVVLCGPVGCGKSTFAAKHFLPTRVVSSDACRAMVADDEADQSATPQAFSLLHAIVRRRLARGRFTVADSTALTRPARRRLLSIARNQDCGAVLLVFDIPLAACIAWNATRPRRVEARVMARQAEQFARTLPHLDDEGFDTVWVLGREDLDSAVVEVIPPVVERAERGPFDVIGDVHGCHEELVTLLGRLGYRREDDAFAHPEGRQAVFLGDLPNRGPDTPGVLATVAAMVARARALYIPGNQCAKLYRMLRGETANPKPAVAATLEAINALAPVRRERVVRDFLALYESAPPYLVLDEGRFVVTHAGIEESMMWKTSDRVIRFVREGEVVGRTPEGRPVRRDWAAAYRGAPLVVYGHTPSSQPVFVHNTINIDQGCVYGGALSALRYPEREVMSEPARRVYWPVKSRPDGAC